jgi:hypothetical protein
MATTPNITLTCTLNDLNGNPVQRGTVTIVLFGFGAIMPMIAGTSMLAKVGPIAYSLADGTFDEGLALWGNDQITPLNQTFYCITIEDEKKNVVQAGIYQFVGGGTLDLSDAQQVAPGIGVPPLQAVTNDVWIMEPGYPQTAPPGSVYTLSRAPYNGQIIALFYNGQVQINGLHYSLSGQTITLRFSTGLGDNLMATYVGTSVS